LKQINASIITIGDELLIGQTIDTNSAWMAQELNKIGIWVKRRVAVGDVWDDIWNALDAESKESDIIFITGGLGPTADDITKPLLCKYFGGKMVVNKKALQHIKDIFTRLNRPMLERNLKQAEVPDVCTVLHNERGTAPGMWFSPAPSNSPEGGGLASAQSQLNENTDEKKNHFIEGISKSKVNELITSPGGRSRKRAVFISLPGVPNEMKGLMIYEVLPRLQKEFDLPAIIHKTVFTAGEGESFIAEKIKEFENSLPQNIKLAYLPAYGMVRLRLTARGDVKKKVEEELIPYFEKLKERVKDVLVTNEDEGLEIVIGKILKAKDKTMATAESCTGGYLAHLITSVPGSSAYFKGSVVSYANEVKENVLAVSAETLKTAGAVSKETVTQMLNGVIEKLNVDYAVATSGIMGPDGGTPEKPVGTVWIAAGNKEKVVTQKLFFRFDRERNIEMTAQAALNMLRKFILEN
jgi:nicotinamide-nucleotide amidase